MISEAELHEAVRFLKVYPNVKYIVEYDPNLVDGDVVCRALRDIVPTGSPVFEKGAIVIREQEGM